MLKYVMGILFGALSSFFVLGIYQIFQGNYRQGLIYTIISFYVIAREYFVIGGLWFMKKK